MSPSASDTGLSPYSLCPTLRPSHCDSVDIVSLPLPVSFLRQRPHSFSVHPRSVNMTGLLLRINKLGTLPRQAGAVAVLRRRPPRRCGVTAVVKLAVTRPPLSAPLRISSAFSTTSRRRCRVPVPHLREWRCARAPVRDVRVQLPRGCNHHRAVAQAEREANADRFLALGHELPR